MGDNCLSRSSHRVTENGRTSYYSVTQTPDPPTDARPMLAPVSEEFLAHLGAGIPFPATPVRPDEYAQLVTMSARLRPPGNRPGERRLAALGPSRSFSIVSNASADLRHGGTPETLLVTDLVRTHTSPGHENDPQAKLAGR